MVPAPPLPASRSWLCRLRRFPTSRSSSARPRPRAWSRFARKVTGIIKDRSRGRPRLKKAIVSTRSIRAVRAAYLSAKARFPRPKPTGASQQNLARVAAPGGAGGEQKDVDDAVAERLAAVAALEAAKGTW